MPSWLSPSLSVSVGMGPGPEFFLFRLLRILIAATLRGLTSIQTSESDLRKRHHVVAVLLPISWLPLFLSNPGKVCLLFFFFFPCFCFWSCYNIYIPWSFATYSNGELLSEMWMFFFFYRVLGHGQNKEEKIVFSWQRRGFLRLFLIYFLYNFAFLWWTKTRFKIKYCKPRIWLFMDFYG